MNGIFCANFATPRHIWTACQHVWCGKCYVPHELDRFYHHIPVDEEGFDWRPATDLTRHRLARNGDHLLTTFQCDLCLFRNLQGRNPLDDSPKDALLLCCIRRANLDAVWGRESDTVNATLRAVKQMVRMWRHVGLEPSLPALGPFPVGDSLGLNVAIAMLLKSLEPGRYRVRHQQFESIRKLRAGYSNVFMISQEGLASLRTFGGERVKHYLTTSPTQSLWFERFSQGCVKRMGQEVRQDWAIPLPAMHALLEMLETEWSAATCLVQKSLLASIGAYATIAFCGSFRGPEVFLTDLHGLRKYLGERSFREAPDHVIIPLLGRYKGELTARYHLTPLAAETSSGLKVLRWVERLVQVREQEGRVQGPAFCDHFGRIARSSDIESPIMERLQLIQAAQPGVIPPDVDVFEDFGINRSFRRGATSTARTRGVNDKLVDLINRWRKFENARGRRPTLTMQEHYSDIAIMIPELIKFSKAL